MAAPADQDLGGLMVVMVQVVIGARNNKLHLPLGAIVDVGVASVGVL